MVLEATIDFKKLIHVLKKKANNLFYHLVYGIYFCYPNLKPQQKRAN